MVSNTTVNSALFIALIIGGFTFYQNSNKNWAVQEQFNKRVEETFIELSSTLKSLNSEFNMGTSGSYRIEEARKDNKILELTLELKMKDLEIKFLEVGFEQEKK